MKSWTKYCGWGVAVLAAIVYFNSLPNGFVSDDQQLIFEHPYTKKVADWPAIFTSGHYAGSGGYRPLTTLSFAVNYLFSRENSLGYHAVNVVLHALVSALVFLLLLRLFRSFAIALCGGLLFAVHPIHTEAVAWISGRAEILCGIFFFGAWLLYLKSKSGERLSLLPFFFSLLLFFASLLSKENALIFPAAIFLGDIFTRRLNIESPPVSLRRLSIFYGAYLAVVAAYFVFRTILYSRPITRAPAQIQFIDNPLAHAPLLSRIATALKIQADYLGLLLWPQNLCGDYSFNSVPLLPDLAAPAAVIAAAIILVLALIAAVSFVRRGHLWFGIIFYFLAILPVSNLFIITGTVKAERLLYLPSFGFCAAVGILWAALQTQSKRRIQQTLSGREVVALALIVVVILAAGWRTRRRNFAWRNEDVFWRQTAITVPDNIKVWQNLGYRWLMSGDLERAIAAFGEVIRINPDSEDGVINLGVALLRSNRNEEAFTLYQEAIQRHPERAALHINLALAAGGIGKTATAVQEFRRAIELDPKNSVIHFNLGLTLSKSGDLDGALAEYRAAVGLKPDYAEGWNAVGAVLMKLQRRDEARIALKKALEFKPNYTDAIFNLTLLDAPR